MTIPVSRYYSTRARRAALLTSAATGVFFAALLGVMFYLRWAAEAWPAPFHFASLLMVTGLTMFGLAASATFEIGSRAVGFPDREPALRWIAVGIATWLTFLFLEIVEWIRLVYLVQLGPDTAFGSTFLALTGAHWIAVGCCVAWMTWAANDTRSRDVLAPAIFSHFLNLVWIVLVATLYLPNADIWGLA
jgi:cytochrome aa3-600 menaquinol oxidase subunit 3